MLDIINATKIFGKGTPNENMALDHLSLSLKEGEFVTILGSNGAGKSTLFNAICGDFLLDEGGVFLDGRYISHLPEYKRASVIGRLFQDPMKGTAPNLTIEENLALAYSKNTRGLLHFAIRAKDREKFREELSRFGMGLEDRMNDRIGLLSGGQRQVVTLLMSTIVTPRILLLDEHTAALDPAAAEKIIALTEKIVAENNITCLMITHNMNQAVRTGNRTLMMADGRIILDLNEEEKRNTTIEDLMRRFKEGAKQELDDDRILLSE